MSKKKLFLGGAALVVATFVATMAFVCYIFDVEHTLRFYKAVRFVESEYVNSVDTDRLIDGAITGMMDSLGDPHSIYMNAGMYKELDNQTKGSFGGVGIEMNVKDKMITVVSPIEGTPSALAGIRAGDRIVKIDGEEVQGASIEKAALKIRGEVGTPVTLTIRREGEEDKDYALTRSNIEIKTAAGKMLDGGIGYIRIAAFSEHTGIDTQKIYRDLEAQGMRAVVLDLRSNPGGVLGASVDVGQLFVPAGPIVSIIKRDGSKEVYDSGLKATKYPVAVLINGGSASASEIVAGAIQDTGAGTLIGTKSYGKGSVQAVKKLMNDAVKLTIAKYYTPSGRSIDGTGIEPDIVVDWQGGPDTQLAKAIEVLKEKLQ